jgi:hypothetical protein
MRLLVVPAGVNVICTQQLNPHGALLKHSLIVNCALGRGLALSDWGDVQRAGRRPIFIQ